MHRKLLFYMLTLVLVIVVFIGVGLFFVGQFSTTKGKYSNNLTFQNEFYARQIEKYFDDITMMSEMLATDSSAILDNYLTENGIHLSALNDSQLYTEGAQKALYPKLKEELLKADASGAFIMLNATVNTGEANSDKSKTGLYFQRSTLDRTDETLLLYRGIAELGRKNGIMPHRKWRLEFKTDYLPQTKKFFNETIIKEKNRYSPTFLRLTERAKKQWRSLLLCSARTARITVFAALKFQKIILRITLLNRRYSNN